MCDNKAEGRNNILYYTCIKDLKLLVLNKPTPTETCGFVIFFNVFLFYLKANLFLKVNSCT